MCCAPGISYCKAWLSELSSVSWPVFELSLVSQQECWAMSVTAAWSLRAVAALCRSNECPGSHKSHRVHVQGYSGSFSHRAALGVHVLPHSQQDCHLLHTAPLCKVPVRKSCFIPRVRTLLLSVLKITVTCIGDLSSVPFATIPHFCHCWEWTAVSDWIFSHVGQCLKSIGPGSVPEDPAKHRWSTHL